MYTGVLDQNWSRGFFRQIGYTIEHPSKLYEENQATIKRVPEDRINTQTIPLDIIITALHELCIIFFFK